MPNLWLTTLVSDDVISWIAFDAVPPLPSLGRAQAPAATDF